MWWLLAIATLILTAGTAKLTTIGINRFLSTPRSKWVVRVLQIFQLAMLPLYIGYIGYRANHILEASRRSDPAEFRSNFAWFAASHIHYVDAVLIMAGTIGFALLIRAAISYQMYRPPKCLVEDESRIVDFRQSQDLQPWHQTLVGHGPMRSIALLPGNEQFLVNVSTKTFVLPRLPQAWDGLSMVHLTDTHFIGVVKRKYFEAVCEQAAALKPDLLIFTGDLLDDMSLLDWLPETLGRLNAPLGRYFILGNHDWYQEPSEIRLGFERLGWISLAGRSIELPSKDSGPPIVLAGDETPWMGSHPSLMPQPNDQFSILLSHTPDNISWARQHGVDLMLAGHTHGGQIRLPILGPIYSPSRYGCRFSAGIFWLDPTLLYVSRGLSGREPIRYQCSPELTKIVLRSNRSAEAG